LSRALIQLAMAQAEADAQAEAEGKNLDNGQQDKWPQDGASE
jgi:hypothetical protein